MSELVATEWYAATDCVGFVLIKDEHDGYKCYVGGGKSSYGFDEQQDIERIRESRES